MKRAAAVLLLLAALLSLTACTPNAAPETPEAVSGTQGPEAAGILREEAQLRQRAAAFLRAHPDEMEALAARMPQANGPDVIYQYDLRDGALYAYNPGDHIPRERLRAHPILDAAGFLRGTELFDLLYVSDLELGRPACVFLKALADPAGRPGYWCELIRCPDGSGDPAACPQTANAVETLAPGWYWRLEPTPDGPALGAEP